MADLESDFLKKIREWPENHPAVRLDSVLLLVLLFEVLMSKFL